MFSCWFAVTVFLFFFFKQKTAYEMRISDWSSDVCSSDLIVERVVGRQRVLILLIGLEFGTRRLGDDVLRNDAPARAEKAVAPVPIAPVGEGENRRLVDVLQHVVAAAHVAVERRISDRHLRLVAGAEHHRTELVDRKSAVEGKSASVRVDLGGRRIITK